MAFLNVKKMEKLIGLKILAKQKPLIKIVGTFIFSGL
jgi:hypothetical protein